jgi:hypothetical protein
VHADVAGGGAPPQDAEEPQDAVMAPALPVAHLEIIRSALPVAHLEDSHRHLLVKETKSIITAPTNVDLLFQQLFIC